MGLTGTVLLQSLRRVHNGWSVCVAGWGVLLVGVCCWSGCVAGRGVLLVEMCAAFSITLDSAAFFC